MTNALTGDYEAVLEIAITQINGLLGTLHQNGATQSAALQTPHSTTGRIDYDVTPPAYGVFEDWVSGFQRAGSGQGLRDIQTQLTATAPPGAARMLTGEFAALRRSWGNVHPPPPGTVRGTAKLQVSTATITVPDSSSSEITVHAGIRAAYYPDLATTNLPAPIHGDVQAAFEVRTTQTTSGTQVVITPSSQDAKIQFTAAPGSGLSTADQNTLAVQVRNVIRQGLGLLPVDLPTGFPFTLFKGLGSGSSQVIALPLQLSGAAAPASGVQPLTRSFIGASGFAIAVGSDYAIGLFNIDAIRQQINSYSFTLRLSGPFGISASVTFHLSLTSFPTPTFTNGGIEISGTVSVSGNKWWAPSGTVSFTQLITLLFDFPTQAITPAPAGDPNVNVSGSISYFVSNEYVASIVKSQIQQALDANKQTVRDAFDQARATLDRGIYTFDPYTGAWYTSVEITPDGAIVRGDIRSVPRRATVVDVAETDQASAFTALESWIPAGRIDRFIWSWVEYSRYNFWEGEEKSFTDEHRFIFPKPTGARLLGQICLRIEGTQILPGGQEISVAGGTTCSLGGLEYAMDAPSWWAPVTLPVWRPNLADMTVLRNAIAAHVSVQENVPAKEPLSRNVLVYFADWEPKRPLDSLNAALAEVKNRDALMVIVVLPAGAFDASRRDLEGRVGAGGDRRVLLQFTEDDELGWSSMFAVTKRPSAYLVNARREFVWKHEGAPDPAELAAALNQYMVATSTPRFRPLRLAIAQGDPAPDAFFETDDRARFALHRFRGREVLLNFWQSWSAPCLAELGRLQRLHETGKEAPFIVAFHGGNNRDALAEIRKRLNLSFALVQDSEQRIARQYGVRCWPTTILVGADGSAQHIQFGIGHETTSPRAA